MTIAPTPEISPVTPQHHRHQDDGPDTPREESVDAAVDRETQTTLLREVLDMRRRGLLAHEETQAKVDACITDVRTANARLDDVQGRLGDLSGAIRSLSDAVIEMNEGQKLQTAAILKLERRVARNEEEADDTKAAIATALGGEAKARESFASQSEITLTGIRLTVEEHEKKIGRFQSFLDKHLPTKTGRLAVVVGGLGAAWPIIKVIFDVAGKLQ